VSEAGKQTVERLYQQRHGSGWRARMARALRPPAPFVANPNEQIDAPLGRWNLYIGGGGCVVDGYVNLDLFPMAGVDVAADAARLPFGDAIFQRVECDAVLEHVPDAEHVMREIERVLQPGGYTHVVTPFCHPFHEYPKDYRRFTPDGLCAMAGGLEVVGRGWRTGPTATMLVFTLEYVKMLLPWRWWRVVSHGVVGWALFPLRYLDLWMLRSGDPQRIGNHCYVWLRKPMREVV
jgi:SAM-dependent methyltransferase